MIRTLAALAFLASSVPAYADTLTLSSTYDATGTNPDGSAYKGKVTVESLSDTTFALKWTIGDSVIDGFGMRENDSLAATYMINGEPGLVVYKLEGTGLDGLWAIKGRPGNGTEHLTPTQ